MIANITPDEDPFRDFKKFSYIILGIMIVLVAAAFYSAFKIFN